MDFMNKTLRIKLWQAIPLLALGGFATGTLLYRAGAAVGL